jgi:hypothetical protein
VSNVGITLDARAVPTAFLINLLRDDFEKLIFLELESD